MIGSIFPGFHRGDEKMARIAGRNRMDAAEPSPTDRPHILLTSVALRDQNDYSGPAAQDAGSGQRARPKPLPLCWTERIRRHGGRHPRPKPLCWTDRTRR